MSQLSSRQLDIINPAAASQPGADAFVNTENQKRQQATQRDIAGMQAGVAREGQALQREELQAREREANAQRQFAAQQASMERSFEMDRDRARTSDQERLTRLSSDLANERQQKEQEFQVEMQDVLDKRAAALAVGDMEAYKTENGRVNELGAQIQRVRNGEQFLQVLNTMGREIDDQVQQEIMTEAATRQADRDDRFSQQYGSGEQMGMIIADEMFNEVVESRGFGLSVIGADYRGLLKTEKLAKKLAKPGRGISIGALIEEAPGLGEIFSDAELADLATETDPDIIAKKIRERAADGFLFNGVTSRMEAMASQMAAKGDSKGAQGLREGTAEFKRQIEDLVGLIRKGDTDSILTKMNGEDPEGNNLSPDVVLMLSGIVEGAHAGLIEQSSQLRGVGGFRESSKSSINDMKAMISEISKLHGIMQSLAGETGMGRPISREEREEMSKTIMAARRPELLTQRMEDVEQDELLRAIVETEGSPEDLERFNRAMESGDFVSIGGLLNEIRGRFEQERTGVEQERDLGRAKRRQTIIEQNPLKDALIQ